MRRRSSLLVLGLFAAGATAQVAACSSTTTPGQQTSSSGGGTDSGPQEDASAICPLCCSGALPVMWIDNGDGTASMPDWTCYPPTTSNSYDRPFVEDAGDDGSADASDAESPDAGTDAGSSDDSGSSDASGPGTDSGPDSGPVSSTDYLLHLVDFSSLQAPQGATVDLFWGGSIAGIQVAQTSVVGSDGLVTFHPPVGQLTLSYRIHPSTDAGVYDQEALYWYNLEIVPPGVNAGTAGNGQLESNSITVSTASALITAVLGSQPPQANLATLVTAARDCQNRDVTGAQLKLVDSTGQDVTAGASGPAAPVTFYFLNNIPDTTCSYTNNSGGKAIWAIVNAPVNQPGSTHVYTLQMYGRMSASDPAGGSLISSADVELYPGGNTVARVYKQGLPAAN